MFPMQETVIERVAYARTPTSSGEGIRVIFSYSSDTDDDVFEFDHPSDVQDILYLISHLVSPESLMVAIRNKAEITLH